jgi:hypothetical protein
LQVAMRKMRGSCGAPEKGFLAPDLAIRLDLTEGGTIIWRSDWNHI